jgi:cation transporter-like permease
MAAAPLLAQQSRCAADPHDSSCGLDTTLHLLKISAIVLAVLLVVIIIAAVAVYRRNQRARLTPDD